tara:strand:+ start:2043 stop:2453 length:411 start_codon:yes stop_codon:yes gene_type:complete
MDLFPFIKVLFSDSKTYSTLKSNDKGKNFFMVNRFMSIKYPMTSQQLNRNGINGSAVMDLWHIVAIRFGRVPGWIYTKTKKVKDETVWKPDPTVSTIWMERHGLGDKDLAMAIKFNPEEMKKSFKRLEKQIQVHAQ